METNIRRSVNPEVDTAIFTFAVLLIEETGGPRENYRFVANH
jgi:hypothetical protein